METSQPSLARSSTGLPADDDFPVVQLTIDCMDSKEEDTIPHMTNTGMPRIRQAQPSITALNMKTKVLRDYIPPHRDSSQMNYEDASNSRKNRAKWRVGLQGAKNRVGASVSERFPASP